MPFALCVLFLLASDSAFPGPCSAEQTSLGRNLHSAFGTANFFMEDILSCFMKCVIARPDPESTGLLRQSQE